MEHMANDAFVLGGHTFESRFILGSGKYSLELIQAAVEKAGAQDYHAWPFAAANEGGWQTILDYIPKGVTAYCLSTVGGKECPRTAVRIARLSEMN